MNRFYLFVLFICPCLHAETLTQIFPQGSGSNFRMQMKQGGDPINLSIYVASNKPSSVNIEYYMQGSAGLMTIRMWQQFEIETGSSFQAKIVNGYIKTNELPKPEKLTSKELQANDGVQVNDFLFSDPKELEKNKVGFETIQIPAGSTQATHYRTTKNGQTINYWISDDAKPIGLVKLESTHVKSLHQNYSLELVSLVKNVKASINPKEAVPLTSLGKALLSAPRTIK